jgi:cytosine/adenosine deaminase-related metal-dependent hydrolase
MQILTRTGTRIVHCPSSNLNLASGLCPVPELTQAGAHISLGADGAACNNRLDMFQEMRLAALIHKPRCGATTMPAPWVLRMATRHGAEALGNGTGGRLEAGCDADFTLLNPNTPATLSAGDPHGTVVYAMTPANVEEVWIGGTCVVKEGRVLAWDTAETLEGASKALARVVDRAGL